MPRGANGWITQAFRSHIGHCWGGSMPLRSIRIARMSRRVSRRRWTISESGLATVDAPPVCIAASIKRSAVRYPLVSTAAPLHTASRHCETHITRDHNFGVGQTLLFHQLVEFCGISRCEPHAAVRRRAANPAGVEVAVDRVARLAEENGMRHWRVVPLLREMVSLHAERRVSAARCVMAGLAGGYGPNPAQRVVDLDRHALS